MKEKENFRFETLKTPLTTGITERGYGPADNVVSPGSGAGLGADPDADKKGVRTESIQGYEVEIEIRYDKPTEAERKAVENFFDWLLAEALRLAGEIGKAA